MNWLKSTFCIVRLNVDSDVSFLLFKCILHAFVSIRISQHIAPLPHARSAYDAMFFLAWFCHGSGISWVSENGLISPQGLYIGQSNQLIFNMHSTSLVWSRPTKAKQKNNNSVKHRPVPPTPLDDANLVVDAVVLILTVRGAVTPHSQLNLLFNAFSPTFWVHICNTVQSINL